jgi:hypothetical protein
MAKSPEDIKREALETATIVEETLRSITDNITLAFEAAMAGTDRVSQTVAKDIQARFNKLAKVTDDLASNAFKLQQGLLDVNKVQDQINKRKTDELSLGTQLVTYLRRQGNAIGTINDLIEKQADGSLKLTSLAGGLDVEYKKLIEDYKLTLEYGDDFVKTLETQKAAQDEINQKLGNSGKLLKGISKIPILGNLIDTNDALKAMTQNIADGGNKTSAMRAGFKNLGSQIKTSLLDPLVLLGVTIKLFKELVKMGLAFSQRTAEIARNLGISSSEAKILNQRFSDITASSNNLLSTQTNLLEATNQINYRFGTSAMLTESMLEDQIDLTKKLGLSGEEAAAFAEYSLLSGKSQEDIVNSIGKQNKSLFSNKKVISEVARIEGQLSAQYKNDPKSLAQAVIQAQKLGMTLEQTQKISKSLLNFEESISNELSAELLTGMDLNLEKARYLALTGKSAEAAEELMKNLGPNGLNKFNNMNVIQQEALASALGMNADELANSLRTQQAISKLSVKDKQAYKDAIKAAQEKGDYDKAAALEKQMNQGKEFELAKVNLDAQQKFNAAVDKLKGLLASIVEGPLGQMAETIANMIAGITKIPGVKEILGYAAPIAAVLTGGMLIKSLTGFGAKGTPMNPMVVTMAGSSGGGMVDDLFGSNRGTKGGLGRLSKAAKGGGFKGLTKSAGRILKSSMKGNALTATIMGLADAGMNISEGQSPWESIGRAAITGLSSFGAGALGTLVAPGAGTIAGGIAGGIAGDKLGDLIFGERVEMAKGGIVTKPTRALVGEAGPEAVVPLSKLMNEFIEMKKYLSQIATKEGSIYMDSVKVGTTFTVGTYKTQ